MENNEITKQMLDTIDALVRENETLKLANAAQAKQIEALETEVNTLRTAVHQMNLDHKEQAQPDPKKAEEDLADNFKRVSLTPEGKAAIQELLRKAEEDLVRDFNSGTKRAGLNLTAGEAKATIEELLRGWNAFQPQVSEYDRLRAQFPGIFEKYGPILGVAIIRKK